MQRGLLVSKAYLSLVEEHMVKWKTCTACAISTNHKVFFRGYIPANILIIGGGPLIQDEDVGKPMQGDNGAILDELIDETIGKFHRSLKVCVVNSVLCRGPTAPDKESIRACSSRLAEFIQIAKPKLLIAAGKEAGSAIISLLAHLPEYPRSIEIRGPGYVARLSGDDRSVEMERIKLSINKALNNVFGQKAASLTENRNDLR